MNFENFKNETICPRLDDLKNCQFKKKAKKNFKDISMDNSGQGAAEYILLFGGVIVIALAGLMIYRSYFSNTASGLNATEDISSIRNNMTGIYWLSADLCPIYASPKTDR